MLGSFTCDCRLGLSFGRRMDCHHLREKDVGKYTGAGSRTAPLSSLRWVTLDAGWCDSFTAPPPLPQYVSLRDKIFSRDGGDEREHGQTGFKVLSFCILSQTKLPQSVSSGRATITRLAQCQYRLRLRIELYV